MSTKEGVGASVLSRHPLEVREELRQEGEAAMRGDLGACLPRLAESFRIEVSYHRHQDGQNNCFYPGAERLGARRVGFATQDYFEVLRFIHFCV